mmetsp:Transcript_51584/g.81911  ORF Transcript_51584/g.81911 Transcript_51584/m.81911 type:complete len:95 (+) Transcript_51584:1129-1413(+)
MSVTMASYPMILHRAIRPSALAVPKPARIHPFLWEAVHPMMIFSTSRKKTMTSQVMMDLEVEVSKVDAGMTSTSKVSVEHLFHSCVACPEFEER